MDEDQLVVGCEKMLMKEKEEAKLKGKLLVTDLDQSFRQYLANSLGDDWKEFIRQLPCKKVSDEQIDAICKDNVKTLEQSYQAFRCWCKANPTACWSHVREVLQEMGKNQLLAECDKDLRRIHTTSDKIKVDSKKRFANASEELRKIYTNKFQTMEQMIHNSKEKEVVCRENIFVDLKINSSKNESEKWKHHVDREYYITQRDNNEGSIKMADVFNDDKKIVIVSGIAGIGKTTLMIHSLLEWVKRNHWHEFEFVFHIPCREVNFLNNCSSAEDLLKECFPTVMQKISFTELMGIADRVLFVVDGLDEFQFIEDILKISRGGSEVKPIAMALNGILNQNYLPMKSCLLLAGRPETASKIKRMLLLDRPLCVDIVGFSENSVQQYIAKRAGDNVELKSLITETIARSPSMQIMATVPIYLEVMCAILGSNNDVTFRTMTELYTWMLLYYVQKHFKDKGETRFIDMPIHNLLDDSDVMETIYFVCKMAYQMLKEGRIVFDSKSFGKFPGDSLENCGLVFKVNVSQLKDAYQFRHLSVMEFCSAVYIINNLSDKVDSVINDPRFEGCIPIVCGLEGALSNNLDTPPIVEIFVEALKLERRPSSWLHYLLEQNKKDSIGRLGGLFLASFFEAQSPISRQYKRRITRWYGYAINDDYNAIRRSQEFYFLDNLMKVGWLNLARLYVDCEKQMSRDLQAIVMKLMCRAEVIDILRLPENFNVELFAQTVFRRSSSKPPIKWLIYSHYTIETFRMLFPVLDVVEELWIHLPIECCVEETKEMINTMKTMKSWNRIIIYNITRRNPQHEHLYEGMREELEGLGKEVELPRF